MTYQYDQLADLAAFVDVVAAGGFTAAARTRGTQKALLSRRVQTLEKRLGVRLLERTTRVVRLTELGARFHLHAARAIEEARAAEEAVTHDGDEPVGTVRVSATELLADLVLRPVVLAYLARYPRASVDVDVGSRPVDLLREGFDVALRVGRVIGSQGSLVARPIGVGRTRYVASPRYLARHGVPRQPSALMEHGAVVIAGGSATWPFARRGKTLTVEPPLRLRTSSYGLALEAALGGVGIARLPDFFVARDLRAGRLVTVLDAWSPPEAKVFVVHGKRDHLPAKTRAFVDALVEHTKQSTLGRP